MFKVMVSATVKTEMIDKVIEMSAKKMKDYKSPKGLLEATVLFNKKDGKIVKLLLWESEEDFNREMGSEEVKESMKMSKEFLTGPVEFETFDEVIKVSGDKLVQVM